MIIYTLPSFFMALFAVSWVVKEFGWASLFSLPYIILLIWLAYSAAIAFVLRWQEAGTKTELDIIIEKLDEILTELRQERNERTNKSKQ